MLLALDAGNTNITIGVFRNGELANQWRLRTVHDQTEDEWGILLRNLFSLAQLDFSAIKGVIISSVVPQLDPTLTDMSRDYFHREPVFVTHETDIGLEIAYDNPREVGADRLVNSVAAHHLYGGPCIIVDFGTAITFDVVSADAKYLGGIITAGIGVSISALFAKAARLPMIDFREPDKLIGTNTVGSMQSGFYFGAISLIDGMIVRLLDEIGPDTRLVATGGHAELIVNGSRHLKTVDQNLTLDGLRLIWDRVKGKS
jgi:type III pantothenate kinase